MVLLLNFIFIILSLVMQSQSIYFKSICLSFLIYKQGILPGGLKPELSHREGQRRAGSPSFWLEQYERGLLRCRESGGNLPVLSSFLLLCTPALRPSCYSHSDQGAAGASNSIAQGPPPLQAQRTLQSPTSLPSLSS